MARKIGSSEFVRLERETRILRNKKIELAEHIRRLGLPDETWDLIFSYAECEAEYAEMMETLRWAREQDD